MGELTFVVGVFVFLFCPGVSGFEIVQNASYIANENHYQ